MADNFTAGYTFDGATGLKTGANLEDLVTLARFTTAAFNGDASSLFDGSTIQEDGDGNAYVAALATTALTGTIGTSQIANDAVTADKAADGIIDHADKIVDGVITLAKLATALQTLIPTAVNAHAFRAYISSAQSVPSSVATKAVFDGESFDYASEYDAVTSQRFTATVAGVYFITAMVEIAVQSGQWSDIYIYKNGAKYTNGTKGSANGTDDNGVIVSDLIPLAIGDYIEIFVIHDNASSQAIEVGETESNFSGYLVGTI